MMHFKHNFSARKLWFGFLTLAGIQKKGYFIPYRYADITTYNHTIIIKTLFERAYPVMAKQLKETAQFAQDLQAIPEESNPPLPHWKQDWFPRLDAIMAYSFIRRYKPKRIIEIGSGHSTRFMIQAVRDNNLSTQFYAIDPEPRASFQGLPVSWQKTVLQEVDLTLFKKIKPGDIVFMDSSHIFMPGTDVDYFWQCIFPILPKGCLLHFHDIFLPDPYPQEWVGRNYNEQNVIALLLLNNVITPLFSSFYVLAHKKADIHIALAYFKNISLKERAYETSLWCKKVA